jgi:hypothetical protein
MPSHRARGASEGPRDLLLTGPSLFDQIDHRVSLRHPIRLRILSQRDPRNEHHTVALLTSHHAPRIDHAQIFRIADFGKQILLLIDIHTGPKYPVFKKADRFESAPRRASKPRKYPGLSR